MKKNWRKWSAVGCLFAGLAGVSTAETIVPPTLTDWTYQMCDEAGPSIIRSRSWCEAMDGTWVVGPDCVNDSPPNGDTYPRIADRFPAILHNVGHCGSVISEWGITSNSRLCHGGPSQYKNGVVVREQQKRTYECDKGDRIVNEIVWVMRWRDLKCPEGARVRYDENNYMQCVLP